MKKTTGRKAAPSKTLAAKSTGKDAVPIAATLEAIVARNKPSKGEVMAMTRIKARTFKTEEQAERAAQDAHLILAMFGLRVARLPDGKFGYAADTDEAEAVKQIDEAPPPDDGISFDVEPPPKPAPLAKSQRTDPAVTKLPARVAQGGGSKQRNDKPKALQLETTPAPTTPPSPPSIFDPVKGRTTGKTVFVVEFQSPDADVQTYVIEALRNLGSGWRIRVLEADAVDREKQVMTMSWHDYQAWRSERKNGADPVVKKQPRGDGDPAPVRVPRAGLSALAQSGADLALRKQGVSRKELMKLPGCKPVTVWASLLAQAAQHLSKQLIKETGEHGRVYRLV